MKLTEGTFELFRPAYLPVLAIGLTLGLFALSKPTGPWPVLTWCVLVPALIVMRGMPASYCAGVLFTSMLGVYFIALKWFVNAIAEFTGVGLVGSYILLGLLCSYLALPYALSGWLVGRFSWLKSPAGAFYISALIVLLGVWIPMPVQGSFAHSFYQQAERIQLAELGGAPAVLFVILLVNVFFAQGVSLVRRRRAAALAYFAGATSAVLLVSLYGQIRLQAIQVDRTDSETVLVGIVQPYLKRDDTNDSLYAMTRALVDMHPNIDLLVWPEISNAFSYADNRTDRRAVGRLIRQLEKPLVLVSGYDYGPGSRSNAHNARYFNTSHALNAQGKLVASYSKQKLVPFFEYLPYESALGFLRTWLPGVLRYAPGTQTTPFVMNDRVTVAPLICYEATFPGLVDGFVTQGSNLLINLTNDYWLGDTIGSEYHLALAVFRSIETRLSLVRVANSGISGLVHASGEIDPASLTRKLSKDTRVFSVPVRVPSRAYNHSYLWFIGGLALVVMLGVYRSGQCRGPG